MFETNVNDLLVYYDERVLVVLAVVVVYAAWRLTLPGNRPPGPPPLPLVVGLSQSCISPTSVVPLFVRLYGDISSFYVSGQFMVIISDVALVREVFVKHADVSSGRDSPPVFKVGTPLKGSIVFNEGPEWKNLRRLGVHALRYFGMGKKSSEEKILEENQLLYEEIRHFDGKPFDPTKLLNNALASIMCRLSFSKGYLYSDPEFQGVLLALRSVLGDVVVGGLLSYMPWLYKTPLYRKLRQNFGIMESFLRARVAEHKRTFDQRNIRDIVDMCLQEACRNEPDSPSSIEEDDIWRLVLDLFIGGTETSANTLTWALLYMAANPDVQEKVAEEIHTVVGLKKSPTYEERHRMPYTRATINEVMRVRPVLPYGVGHVTSAPLTVAGYTIPARSVLLMNVFGMHHDARYWEDPLTFNPDRFLIRDTNGAVGVEVPEAFKLFGAGRRACLGEQLAQMELFLFFSSLLQRFIFKLPDGQRPNLDYQPQSAMMVPYPYSIRAIPRHY